ncbi:MAG: hypothetical protein IKK11_00535, partial [Oscillospiraceae bacterium]|nr:hypothetical protein [Oscillospiraceae bacterium]
MLSSEKLPFSICLNGQNPLLFPQQIFDISTQLCVVAFAFGDGFSNVFYPTNAALLISLGLADVSYGDWF